jgi:hypothetical protein
MSQPVIASQVIEPTDDVELTTASIKHEHMPGARDICENLDSKALEAFVNSKYVYCEKIASILARALRTGKNVLLFGPTGHAKSAVINDVIQHLGLDPYTFTQDFGEGTDEASLWGGYNFQRMKEENILDFHPDRSFLNKEIAIFEELFDAPPQVLCSLKNTLTSKWLSKGADPYKSKNKVIIALTNKNPDEIIAMGESYKALVDRFPLRMCVKWSDYSEKAYEGMFDILGMGTKAMRSEFSKIIALACKDGKHISPRTAVQAFEIVLDAASEYATFDERALMSLEFIAGLEEIGKTKIKEWSEKVKDNEFTNNLETWKTLMETSKELIESGRKVDEVLEAAYELQTLEETLINLTIPAKFDKAVRAVQEQITEVVEGLTRKAMDLNKIIKENPRASE